MASETPPKYERKEAATLFSPFEPRVAALLADLPEMPATVVAERVGWDGSIWFRRALPGCGRSTGVRIRPTG